MNKYSQFKRLLFDTYHPALSVCYFVIVLVIIMAAFHPVLLALSFVVGLAYNIYLKGREGIVKSFKWQIPLLVIIVLLNPLLNKQGSTVLFVWGDNNAYYLEGMLYGLFLGIMLMSILTWFSNLSAVLSTDDVMQLMSPRIPVISMMCVMILRLVPLFARRGNHVQQVSDACTCSGQSKMHRRIQLFRTSSVLLGWGMEDSIETSLIMQARGWGSSKKRSSYKTCTFRTRDAFVLAFVLALTVLCAIGIVQIMQGFSFYPSVSALYFHWAYVVYLALLLVPLFLKLKGQLS